MLDHTLRAQVSFAKIPQLYVEAEPHGALDALKKTTLSGWNCFWDDILAIATPHLIYILHVLLFDFVVCDSYLLLSSSHERHKRDELHNRSLAFPPLLLLILNRARWESTPLDLR